MATAIVAILLALLVVFAVWRIIKRPKNGCGGCSGCPNAGKCMAPYKLEPKDETAVLKEESPQSLKDGFEK